MDADAYDRGQVRRCRPDEHDRDTAKAYKSTRNGASPCELWFKLLPSPSITALKEFRP